ncbi:MAG: hypothetical protein US58_C0026G0004 [Candidatus Magasanikbacteria bacterium GW2011_GWA2_37_8]|uniref:Uncharacterized protein n=1 Tax=Candidatus Magasanikbacteria bacterium GW2011_GWA2_37_8 TaxID=1619036 RepID=A0A0G0H9E4_9BACT|nr:MAG: hypothetical protein US58_C0026G0004 [Candidatus Magasanikbacteria bacterium GW2011_GWA2_37_8]
MIKEYLQYLHNNPKKYWFKAKLYGRGWVPATWQGWLVIVIFVGLLTLNSHRVSAAYPTSEVVSSFALQNIVLVLILILICYKTGEKPHWQWGSKDK